MAKDFSEVFPTLKLNNDLRMIYSDAKVLRIANTSKGDRLRVYIRAPHIIEKKDVYAVEREIVRQLFPNDALTVTIHENFELSAGYNARSLMEAYREMLTYIKSAVTRNYSEKCINSIMDYVSGSASQNFGLLQEFYQTTLRALEEAKNEVNSF